MRVTIDTNILVQAFHSVSRLHLGVVALIEATESVVCMDASSRILREYRGALSGIEMFEKWYQEMFPRFDQRYRGKLPAKHVRRLKHLGCHQGSDHVFIAVACESGKVLFTEDSDMGKGPGGAVHPHNQALAYLEGALGLMICDAWEALRLLSGQLR